MAVRGLLLAAAAAAAAGLRTTPRGSQFATTKSATGICSNDAVLRLFDRKTRTNVVLVGTMHYNPHSIALAEKVVRREAAEGKLRSVVIESCPTRWNSTLKVQPPGSFLRVLCDNEMQAAAEVADEFGCNLELGDQTIEETGRRASQLLALTIVQLLTPFSGGWSRLAEDLSYGVEQLAFADGLRADAILNLRLLAFFPVALFRYAAAILVKNPLLFAILLVAIGLPLGLTESSAVGIDVVDDTLSASPTEELFDLAGSFAVSAVETLVLGRVLLVGLLEERNFALVRSIRRAALAKPPSKTSDTVVAVLGMAHLNGVMRILQTSRVV